MDLVAVTLKELAAGWCKQFARNFTRRRNL